MKLRWKTAIGLAGLATLSVAASLFFLWRSGMWGIVFPSSAFETYVTPLSDDWGANARVRVLVFSKTNGFRHWDGISGAARVFEEAGARREWAVYSTENSAVFEPDFLSRFDVVVFSNTTGNVMSDEQDRAFQTWLEAGGGWVGLHGAGDASHREWQWYQKNLVGPVFIGHVMQPQFQDARVLVEDPRHPVTRRLPGEFVQREEWYSWDASARTRGFEVLLMVDESSYEPVQRKDGEIKQDLRMGDHPVAWWRCVGQGRALYSALGHESAAFESPPVATMLEDAIEWAGHRIGNECSSP